MIQIKGTITEQTAAKVKAQLDKIDGVVNVSIDSPGGDLFAGLKIYDMFADREVNIHVKRAGSVASIIALAGPTPPTVSKTGGFAIHNAHTKNINGNHHDLRSVADSLEKYSQIVARIYQQKTKLSNAQAVSLMNDSTQINAHDAITLGFASSIKEAEAVLNNKEIISQIFDIDMNLLKTVRNNLGMTDTPTPTAEEVEPVAQVAPEEEDEENPSPPEGFTPEQQAQITEMVKTLIADALAGTEEEIGNTIAVVLNEVVSKGTPPTNAKIEDPGHNMSASEAFHRRVEEITKKNKLN